MALVAAKLTDEDLARFRSMDAKKEGYRVKPDGYSAQEIEQNEIALSRFWGEVAKRYGVNARLLGTKRATFVIDEQGTVAWSKVNPLAISFVTVDELRDVLAKLPAPAA